MAANTRMTTKDIALAIQEDIEAALEALYGKELAGEVTPKVEPCRMAVYGDYTTNVAMVLSRKLKKPPVDIAEEIAAEMRRSSSKELANIEPTQQGFINFSIAGAAFLVERILESIDFPVPAAVEEHDRILIEYVSANPTGPLHVGHGRGAAYGSALAALGKLFGHQVDHEYYVNDTGRQADILSLAVWLRYIALDLGADKLIPFPALAYQGSYITDLANVLKEECGNALFPEPGNLPEQDCLTAVGEEQINKLMAYQKRAIGGEKVILIRDFAIKNITQGIKRDLSDFKVYFRNWQSERELIDQEKIEEALNILAKGEHLFHKDGARWFRSTTFGDTKDRVVQRRDGRFTYFASDIAYHKDKFDRKDSQGRPYDRFINVWGADHHGFEARLRAAIEAMGYDQEKLHIVFVQFVTLIRDGKKVPMSTRTGNFVTLRGLYEEVGVDAAHFFFVFRKPSQHLDFDIDLAKSRNEKNPVFYVQYAHARIHSVIAKVQEQYPGTAEEKSGHLYLLKEKEEIDLIRHLHFYPHNLGVAYRAYEPHHVLVYLHELATKFHSCYHRHQVLVDDPHLRRARVRLFMAIARVLGNGLDICNITAPEKM